MPTLKQKKAFKEVVGNGGNITKAMIAVDYSPATANTPQKLTESKGWKELMDEYMPDSFLAEQHKKLFAQKQVEYFVFPKTMEDSEITEHVRASGIEVITIRTGEKGKMAFYSIPDTNAIKSGLDMSYKLKGNYAPEKRVSIDLTPPSTSSDIDLQSIAKRVAEELRNKKLNEKQE